MNHRYCWIDIETTGLDPHNDKILEIAMAFTEDDPFTGKVVASESFVCGPSKFEADTYVMEMHAKSGLLAALQGPDMKIEDADWTLSRFVDSCSLPSPSGKDWMIRRSKDGELLVPAGNSVHFDMSFIKVHMPQLAKRFGHRLFDVSTLKKHYRDAYGEWPEVPFPEGAVEHRAMGDVLHCIEEYRQYRNLTMVP